MVNPYFSTDVCVERLSREWRKHKKLIVAVDYDDTVFDYHDFGHKHQAVEGILKECQDLGFYIVVFTASDPSRHDGMIKALAERGINVSAVNTNPISLPFGNWGKIYYNILLDDRAGLGQSFEILRKTINIIKQELLLRI